MSQERILSKMNKSVSFQYSSSDSDSSYEERTCVDKSFVTSPVSFTRKNTATSSIGFDLLKAKSSKDKSSSFKASSLSKSSKLQYRRNTSSIRSRNQGISSIPSSGNGFALSTKLRFPHQDRSSIPPTYSHSTPIKKPNTAVNTKPSKPHTYTGDSRYKSDSEIKMHQLQDQYVADHFHGRKSVTEFRNSENSRNRKFFTLTREQRRSGISLRSSMQKLKDSDLSTHYSHSASFRHEEIENARVSEIPVDISSDSKEQENQNQQKNSESMYRFDMRQNSFERFEKEIDSEVNVCSLLPIIASKKEYLNKLKLAESPNLGRRYQVSNFSERADYVDRDNDHSCNSSPSRSCLSPIQGEQYSDAPETLINEPRTWGRMNLEATNVKGCKTSVLNSSESTKALTPNNRNSSQHSEGELDVSPHGRKQKSNQSIEADSPNRKYEANLKRNHHSKSGRKLKASKHSSSSKKGTRRTPIALSRLSYYFSEISAQNAAEDDSESAVVEKTSKKLASTKRKRNLSPRMQQDPEVQEDSNCEGEDTILPGERRIEDDQPTTSKEKSSKGRETKCAKKNRWEKVPSPTPYAKSRPRRNRIRPLAYWEGEYRSFRYMRNGDIVLAEQNLVEPSFSIPNERKKKPVVKKLRVEDDILTNQEQVYFYDKKTNTEVGLVDVHQDYERKTVAMGSGPPYELYHDSGKKNFTSGFIELKVNETREQQKSPKLSLKFIIFAGIVTFTMETSDGVEVSVDVGKKNSIIIPRYIPYSLKNCYAGKSWLYFHSVPVF